MRLAPEFGDLKTEWTVYLLGPFALLVIAYRVLRRRLAG